MSFKIVTVGWNCAQWIEQTLRSVEEQTRQNWTICIIYDPCDDSGADIIRSWCDARDDRWVYRINTERLYAVRNQVDAIRLLEPDDDDIVIFLDLDGDMFAHPQVLEHLAAYYDDETLVTYGSYRPIPDMGSIMNIAPYPENVVLTGTYRHFTATEGCCFNHLRTIKGSVINAIPMNQFLWADGPLKGTFYERGTDYIFMLAALELANGRYKVIPETLLLYNHDNPFADNKMYPGESGTGCVDEFLGRSPLQPITQEQLPTLYPKSPETTEFYLPAEQRIEILRDYGQKYLLEIFIETGTNRGDTPWALQSAFQWLYTIELSDKFWVEAVQRFAGIPNVECLHGDSAQVLPELLGRIDDAALVWLDGHYCTDAATEIFTKRGWLKWDEVRVGDHGMAIDPDTRLSSWQEITSIYVDERVQTPMISMEGKSFSALTTPEHRWMVTNWQRRPYRFKTSEALRSGDQIPLCASRADMPINAVYDDAFVELIAWWLAEGNIHRGGITIGQSMTANPRYAVRIERCMEKLYGPPGPYAQGYQWSINKTGIDKCMRCYIPISTSGDLLRAAPNRVPTMEFLCLLTQQQLNLFIETCMDGDGTRGKPRVGSQQRHGAKNSFTQEQECRTRAFEAACALAGRPTSTSYEKEVHQWHTTLRTSTTTNPVKASACSIQNVLYDGIVWCPTLKHHNWLARRDGRVYFTGNCGGDSALGSISTPIREELRLLLADNRPHVILIDDARVFRGGPEHELYPHYSDYPSLSWVRDIADVNNYNYALQDDIIRLTPRR